MCRVLKLNRSSFYKWANTCETRQKRMYSDALVGAKIKTIFDDEQGLYGAQRIAASLKEDRDLSPVNHKKVARIMKAMGLKGFTKRRRCITTKRASGHQVMPDLVNRNFSATGPNQVYVGDITYLPCKAGKNMYLATVIDVYSRKLVGRALAEHMRTSFVWEPVLIMLWQSHLTPRLNERRCVIGKSLTIRWSAAKEVFRWCMRYNTRRRQLWAHLLAPDVFETKNSTTLTKSA